MQEKTRKKILEINAEFYQTFALQFSETRMRIQPGVRRVLESVAKRARLLDVGCGNGEAAYTLAASGFEGSYIGIDLTDALLEVARSRLAGYPNFAFLQGDLTRNDWDLQVADKTFEMIFAFAVLHHIPDASLRRGVISRIRGFLHPGGRFIHSNWQFVNSERLRKRIQPWSRVAVANDDLDPGDYLLDWRHGGNGLRYVHLFGEEELIALAHDTGFTVIESFYSDGEGGNLGLYQVWEAV